MLQPVNKNLVSSKQTRSGTTLRYRNKDKFAPKVITILNQKVSKTRLEEVDGLDNNTVSEITYGVICSDKLRTASQTSLREAVRFGCHLRRVTTK